MRDCVVALGSVALGSVLLGIGTSSLSVVMPQPHSAATFFGTNAALPAAALLPLSARGCRYKRSQCITSLTEMGFDEATAAAAAEASGCEPTAAATLLMEGGSAIAGGTPASVLR